jgi:hypothetical protein
MSAILGRPTNIFEKPYLFLFNWMFTGLHHYDNLVLHLPPSFSQGRARITERPAISSSARAIDRQILTRSCMTRYQHARSAVCGFNPRRRSSIGEACCSVASLCRLAAEYHISAYGQICNGLSIDTVAPLPALNTHLFLNRL